MAVTPSPCCARAKGKATVQQQRVGRAAPGLAAPSHAVPAHPQHRGIALALQRDRGAGGTSEVHGTEGSHVRDLQGGGIPLKQQIGGISLSWPKWKLLSVQHHTNLKFSANKKR